MPSHVLKVGFSCVRKKNGCSSFYSGRVFTYQSDYPNSSPPHPNSCEVPPAFQGTWRTCENKTSDRARDIHNTIEQSPKYVAMLKAKWLRHMSWSSICVDTQTSRTHWRREQGIAFVNQQLNSSTCGRVREERSGEWERTRTLIAGRVGLFFCVNVARSMDVDDGGCGFLCMRMPNC